MEFTNTKAVFITGTSCKDETVVGVHIAVKVKP
jgi:hypothetical protein